MNQGGMFHEIQLQSEMFADLQRSWLTCPLLKDIKMFRGVYSVLCNKINGKRSVDITEPPCAEHLKLTHIADQLNSNIKLKKKF